MNTLKGHLLIASPELITPFFTRTVILMLDHDADGALGVVLNRSTEVTVTAISEQVLDEPFDWEKSIGLGGPVPGPLMVLHAEADLADREVIAGVYSSVEAGLVQQLVRRRVEPSLVVANYSGWGPAQLEGEFDLDSWLTLPATREHIFWEGPTDLWDVVVKAVQARKLSEFLGIKDAPADPSLN